MRSITDYTQENVTIYMPNSTIGRIIYNIQCFHHLLWAMPSYQYHGWGVPIHVDRPRPTPHATLAVEEREAQ